LAFRDRKGKFVLLARINEDKALLQYADTEQPKIIERDELNDSWGELCLLCKQSRFDIR